MYIVDVSIGELIKRTGDGVMAIFGLNGVKKKAHATRAVFCALAMIAWARQNGYNLRVGLASGAVGSGILLIFRY